MGMLHDRLPFRVLVLVLAVGSPVLSQPTLARSFDDHMVLQREKPVRVWGFGDPGEQVTVSFGDQRKQAKVGEDGSWSVQLDAMEADGSGRPLTMECGDHRRVIADVLVGEVWICGGQSNMEWTLRSSRDADVEIPCAHDPQLRYIRLPKEARPEPRRDYDRPTGKGKKGWRVCSPESAEHCTAVGYYFAQRLRRSLRVPVGLVDISWGGTMAQHWVSKDRLRGFPEMKSYFDDFEARMAAWVDGGREEGAKQRYDAAVLDWEKQRVAAREAGNKEPRKPGFGPFENPGIQRHPGGMYDGMIVPLSGLTVRGALFYQGENNSFGESWKPFPKTYPAVIEEWRAAFRDPQLPIGLIQIAGWSNRRSMTYDMNHHTNVVREVQFDTWKATPNTGLIVTFDTNSNQSIHPGCKRPVGDRTARWALAEVYGVKAGRGDKPLEWRGPAYESMRVEGKHVVVSFEDGTDRGLRLDQDAALGFYVAGEDQVFHVARARVIKDNHLRVWCDEVPAPVAVRYAWSNLPLGSLMNARELPAYPFRSDDWPLTPHQSKGDYHRR